MSRVSLNIPVVVLCFLLISAISCKENVSDKKFSAIAQQKRDYEFLIKKVHDSNWNIGYTFIDFTEHPKYDGKKIDCSSQSFDDFKNNPYKKQLEDKIKEVSQLWLSPLKDKENIISSENIIIQPLIATDVLKPNAEFYMYIDHDIVNNKIIASYDLLIFFGCGFLDGGVVSYSGESSKKNNIPLMTVSSMPEVSNDMVFLTEKNLFRADVLVHEMGHAFGLADAYNTSQYNPPSVMKSSKNALDGKTLVITADDRAGIRWLYRHHVEKSLTKRDCIDGYVYHDISCIPEYPVINRVKSGTLAERDFYDFGDRTLNNLTLISMINEQDKSGNTPLHYAVLREARHATDDMCKILLAKGADTSIKNNEGKTAKDLAKADSRCFPQ